MAKKDLNLSLGASGVPGAGSRPKEARQGSAKRADDVRQAILRQATLRPGPREPRVWPAVALIMVINVMFMATVVYWYSGGELRNLAERPGSATAALARLEVQLASLEVRLGELAGALQPQLHSNSEAIKAVATSLRLVHGDINQLQAQMATVLPTPAEAPVSKARASEWLLNLGSFNDAVAARSLVTKCEALGYSPQIIEQSASGKPLYVVALAGFEDRGAAESSAQAIMERTDLNGLWAWKRQ